MGALCKWVEKEVRGPKGGSLYLNIVIPWYANICLSLCSDIMVWQARPQVYIICLYCIANFFHYTGSIGMASASLLVWIQEKEKTTRPRKTHGESYTLRLLAFVS